VVKSGIANLQSKTWGRNYFGL